MDPRIALRVLINRSTLLTDEGKADLLGRVDGMSDDEVQKIGTFLAEEKAQSIADAEAGVRSVDAILEAMEETNSRP